MVAEIGYSTPNENMAGIEKIHQAGQYIPNHLPAGTDDF